MELKDNTYYYEKNRNSLVISLYKDGKCPYFIFLNKKQYDTKGGMMGYTEEIREATKEEIVHLELCHKAGEWIEMTEYKEEILNYYY